MGRWTFDPLVTYERLGPDWDGRHRYFRIYDVILTSRMFGGRGTQQRMPLYKCACNRLLTAFQNLLTGAKLSEYHSGFGVFSGEVLRTLPLLENSDDFVADIEILAECICFGHRIGEILSSKVL
jgi:hypothetical protein